MRVPVSAEEEWDVFISYATPDAARAADLAGLLEAKGLRPFDASRSIPPEAPWRERITAALQGSRVAAVLLSEASAIDASARRAPWHPRHGSVRDRR